MRGDRLGKLTEQIVPVHRARSELTEALRQCNEAVLRLEQSLSRIHSEIEEFRDPAEVEARFLAHLKQQKTVPRLQFGELKELRGTVLRAGRTPIPLGAQANKSLDIALGQLPKSGANCLRAQQDLEQAGLRLDGARQKEAQLTEKYRPQLLEVEQIRGRLGDLYERAFTLRPRDQLALARSRGGHELKKAAERAPEAAVRTLHLREQWIRNLPRDLDRALDRRFGRTGRIMPGDDYPRQLKDANRELRELTGLKDIRPHDLRRTGRTHVSGLGIRDDRRGPLEPCQGRHHRNLQSLFLLAGEKGRAGHPKTRASFLAAAVYNLVRMHNLLMEAV